MSNKITFYTCRVCKQVVETVHQASGTLVCCGVPMEKLLPNVTEASAEKHVPVVHIEDGRIKVKIGELPHPMSTEHFIEWVVVAFGNRINRYNLQSAEVAEAHFCCQDTTDLEVYAYCNLHGLWKV